MHGDVERVLQLVRKNDSSSVEKALELLQNTVFAFSMKVCGHSQDAEDTAQEVLLKSLPYLPKFDDARALGVWLYKTARNRCLMSRRGAKASPKINLSLATLMPNGRELQELLKSADPSPESKAIQGQASERLHKAIGALPPQFRFVLVLHDMEGLNSEEVAEVTGLRQGTVRVRLHRARLFLRRELARHSNGNRSAYSKKQSELPKQKSCRALFAALSDYMDGIVEDAFCEEMEKHLNDCKPCTSFLRSLEAAVRRCESYRPSAAPLDSTFRTKLLGEYERVRAELGKTSAKRKAKRTLP
jgi:RNA polymerase sigma-70 factor (ECF subfamily)